MIFIKILNTTQILSTTQTRKEKILIALDDMIDDMLNNKQLNPTVTELFIRGRKLIISPVFILLCQKNIRLNSTQYSIMKIPNKQELQQIAFNHSSDIDFKDFMYLYKKCTAKPYSFLLILLLHQIILHVSERIFYKNYKN